MGRYKLAFLPAARQDLLDIVHYIGHELQNPQAAENTAEKLIQAAQQLEDFPYADPVYIPRKPLLNEYRKLAVGHYVLFYWVDEANRVVTVARVLYGKRDREAALK